MYWIERNGLTFLQFPNLAVVPNIFHGIFLRYSTGSNGRPMSFNLGLNCGEPDEQVWKNRLRVRALSGAGRMVFARQVHGSQVAVLNRAESPASRDEGLENTYVAGDAIVSNVPDQTLFIQVADCQSIVMVDTEHRVVANVHSGWRGSLQNIIGRTVSEMKREFGCCPEHIVCGIGPSLGPCCAEFINFRKEIPSELWSYHVSDNRFDFWRLSQEQLAAEGVPIKNIHNSHICTRCNQHLFFSHRGDRHTGRFSAVVGIH